MTFRATSTLLGIFLLVLSAGCERKKNSKSLEQTPITFTREGTLSFRARQDSTLHNFDIEFAENEYEIQTGLMYRESMEDHQGMLFVFPDERMRSFYMKNTEIPLDIIFVRADSTILNIVKNARPLEERSIPSEGPARFVFEINGGLSDRLGLQAGDRLVFSKSDSP